MVAETLTPTQPLFDNRSNNPIFANVRYVPEHLKRRRLKDRWHKKENVPEVLWGERGRAVEIYVADVIATQSETVDHVEINEQWDKEGPDLTVYLVKGSPRKKIRVEVKSSSLELQHGKQKIRDEMFEEEIRATMIGPWTTEKMTAEMKKKSKKWSLIPDAEKEKIISRRLTDLGIILLNGGEKDKKEKTPEEILNDSWNPQLNRIVQKDLREQVPEATGQLVLFPMIEEIQVFPNPNGLLARLPFS